MTSPEQRTYNENYNCPQCGAGPDSWHAGGCSLDNGMQVKYMNALVDERSPKQLTSERKAQHGDWKLQAACARELKETIAKWDVSNKVSFDQREALDMIAVKMSRILNGDPNYADHWDDIAGYAFLGKGGHTQA